MRLKCKPTCILLAVIGLGGGQCLGAFRYADNVTTTGGQFNNSASYAPANLGNNGFTSPTDTIDTRGDYLAAGNNYATLSGTTANFDLTFNFNTPVNLSAMYVWNYVFRNGAGGATSTNSGVNAFTLTFYSGANGSGALLGTYAGNLARAVWNDLNQAETVAFGATNSGVRSVVMHVNSNYGGGFAGMNEVGFETTVLTEPPAITSFSASTNWVTFGSAATLTWTVSPGVTNLVIENGVGDVLPLTTNGSGSIQVSPTRGAVTYALVANNAFTNVISLVGLPPKEKLHIYLLLGQSNMQGAGRPYDSNLDSPHPRVLQFGSRDGMESIWLQAKHPLTSLNAGYSSIGPGLEFAKTMLASNSDPDVVIGLINHAIGSSAIQWWAPGVVDNKQTNPVTGLNYVLYDEAIRRATNAGRFGVLKGALWHQGEYNCNTNNSNPAAQPEFYAARLVALVDHLRRDLSSPGLPFICGKLVPTWTNAMGTVYSVPTFHRRDLVEGALVGLPDQRFNTACVDNDGLTGHEDEVIHFNAGSQRELGRRYAKQLLILNGANQFPPALMHSSNGAQLHLSWPANYQGWQLQVQSNSAPAGLATNWATISSSATTNAMSFPIHPGAGPTTYFRLRSP
jgi:hypothetical protein